MSWPTSKRRLQAARGRAGVSTLEVLIAVSLLAMTAGVMTTTSSSMNNAYNAVDALATGESKARETMAKVTQALEQADGNSLTPVVVSPFSSSWVEFQPATGYEAGTLVWEPTQRLQLVISPGETDDGQDNDGDGLIDEHQLQWIRNAGLPDEQVIVLCSDVAELLEGETFDGADENGNGLIDEPGFCIERDGALHTVRLTVEVAGPQGMRVLRSVERRLNLRVGQ